MSKPIPASKALAVALVGVAAVSVSAAVLAQEAPIERIEITGSAIRRIEAETALPVTTLTREDIAKTGATTATELLQMLPALQGYLTSSDSVNGAGAGVTTASIHALPSKYTLVLIDGQRVAEQTLFAGSNFGGGFAANLESIPLDAVERVEVLTDGASALYGSDAVAGVVNFILRKNSTAGNVYFNWNAAQHPGGDSYSVGFSKGFGDLNTDHFNLLVNYTHDYQQTVMASERPFSAPGAYRPFTYKGTNYIFNQATNNTEPANLSFQAVPIGSPAGTTPTQYSINPFYEAHGNCGPNAVVLKGSSLSGATGESCRFNYAATVEDVPPETRDAGLLKATFKLNDNTTLWGEYLITNFVTTPRYAPPAQPFGVSPTNGFSPLYNRYVVPFLAANGLTDVDPSTGNRFPTTMGYRAVAAGGRADAYVTESEHFSMGLDGTLYGFDYKVGYTRSHNSLADNLAGGYSSLATLTSLIQSGAYDPVGEHGASSVRSAVLHENANVFVSDLTEYSFNIQHSTFDLPGGTSIVAVGGEFDSQAFRENFSPIELANSGYSTQGTLTDVPVGGSSGAVPIDATRNNWGAFAEWDFPFVKQVELDVSGRYDFYNKVLSSYVFGNTPVNGVIPQQNDAEIGNTAKKGTYKLTLRITPIEQLLLRGSYGKGFRAPTLTDIAGVLVFNGSTSGSYPCPFPGSVGCSPGSAQYDLVIGPNGKSGTSGLSPERSTQWTAGFRVEPISQLSIGADLWDVKLKNQILSGGIPEQVAFGNPGQYASLFINPYTDPVGLFQTIALEQLPFNAVQSEYMGIDWDVSWKLKTPIGLAGLQWTGTQMIRQLYQLAPASAGPCNPPNPSLFCSDLGVFGPDQTVTFRTQFSVQLSLQTGPLTNILTSHYKTGYKDESYPPGTSVFLAPSLAPIPSTFPGLDVPSYTTFDWQTVYDYSKKMHLTLGIRNLFDKDPPLSLQSAGGGNQIGYDGRYADAIGRVFYVVAKYDF